MEHTAAYAVTCSGVAWGSVAQPALSNLATTVPASALDGRGSLLLCCSLLHAMSQGLLAQPPCRHAAAHHMRPDYVRAGEVHKEVQGCCLHVLHSAHDGAVSCSCVDACCMCQVALEWHNLLAGRCCMLALQDCAQIGKPVIASAGWRTGRHPQRWPEGRSFVGSCRERWRRC